MMNEAIPAGSLNLEPEQFRNLIVNYIPSAISELQLRQLFEQFGAVESVKIVCDRETHQSRGFGFVKYQTAASAQQAIQSLNGYNIHTKRLKVALAANGQQQRQNMNNGMQRPMYAPNGIPMQANPAMGGGLNPYATQVVLNNQVPGAAVAFGGPGGYMGDAYGMGQGVQQPQPHPQQQLRGPPSIMPYPPQFMMQNMPPPHQQQLQQQQLQQQQLQQQQLQQQQLQQQQLQQQQQQPQQLQQQQLQQQQLQQQQLQQQQQPQQQQPQPQQQQR